MTLPSRTARTLAAASTTALMVVLGALAAPIAGCNRPTAHDPDAAYTPKAIAEELVFRLKTARTPTVAPAAEEPEAGTDDGGVRGLATEVGKKAPGDWTEDDLIAEAAAKIRTIEGVDTDRALDQVIEAIRADATLSDADKDRLAEGLRRPRGRGS